MPFGLGLMPGEDDWLQRILGGGMRTPPIFGGPAGETPGVPLPTPSAAPPERPGFLGKLDKATSQFGGTMPLGLALLANSRGGGGFGEIFGKSALQAQGMNAEQQQQKLREEYMRAQIEAMRAPKPRRPLAVMGPDGKPVYIDEQQAIGHAPATLGSGAEPPASIQEMTIANQQRIAAGQKPYSLEEWLRTRAQMTPINPSVQVLGNIPSLVQPTRTDPRNPIVTPLSTLPAEATGAATIAGAETGAREQAKADVEKAVNAPKVAEQYRQTVGKIDNVMSTVDEALGKVGPATTGIGGALTRRIPGSPAFDLSETLTTVKANLGFSELQQMREASPTGGALGQVAVQELEALQATRASLEQKQSPEQLSNNLQKIRQHYQNWKDAVNQAAGGAGSPAASPVKRKRYNPATGKIE